MSINHNSSAREPGAPLDLESQVPPESTDRAPDFPELSHNEKSENPDLVRTCLALFESMSEYLYILTDRRSASMAPMTQPIPKIGLSARNGVPHSSSQHSASFHPSHPP